MDQVSWSPARPGPVPGPPRPSIERASHLTVIRVHNSVVSLLPMPRPKSLSSLTFGQIQSELRRRARSAGTLQRRRDRIARRLAALDDQIRALGGRANGRILHAAGRGRRARNEKSLPEALHEVLKGKTMRVIEAADAVQQAGYKTNSRTFRVQVNIALVKRKDLFKRVERGQYTAK
jgi:hypothetical protein